MRGSSANRKLSGFRRTNWPAEETGLRPLFQRRFFRWRSSVLKLKPRLRQKSFLRIPLLTNSATSC